MLWKKKKIRKKVRTTEVNKIVTVVLKKDDISYADEAYQWNYGQILRIQGGNLPKAVEVHFSLEETSGTSVTRIGTTTVPRITRYTHTFTWRTAPPERQSMRLPYRSRHVPSRKFQGHRKNRSCSGRQLRQSMTQQIGRSRQSKTPRQVRQKPGNMLPAHRRVQLQQKRPRKMHLKKLERKSRKQSKLSRSRKRLL